VGKCLEDGKLKGCIKLGSAKMDGQWMNHEKIEIISFPQEIGK
jgi:hypothetical protein